MTRQAKKDKATQKYDFTEVLAQGEHSLARFFTGWMPAADTRVSGKLTSSLFSALHKGTTGLLLGFSPTVLSPHYSSIAA